MITVVISSVEDEYSMINLPPLCDYAINTKPQQLVLELEWYQLHNVFVSYNNLTTRLVYGGSLLACLLFPRVGTGLVASNNIYSTTTGSR